jgi:hypothetical protein
MDYNLYLHILDKGSEMPPQELDKLVAELEITHLAKLLKRKFPGDKRTLTEFKQIIREYKRN